MVPSAKAGGPRGDGKGSVMLTAPTPHHSLRMCCAETVMSWALFVDESGQDQRESPFEVLAGVAVEDRQIWPLIRQLSDAQEFWFGTRLFDAFGAEAKSRELLSNKAFRLAGQMERLSDADRRMHARGILLDGRNATRAGLTALGQAKVGYCRFALTLARRHGAQVFATMVPKSAPRPPNGDAMRKDYAFFLERYFHFLNGMPGDPMGFLILDELDKAASHVLLGQISNYFKRTRKGRARARLIVPEPLFVHSDLTTIIQVADIVAYAINWGLRLSGMKEPARPDLAPLAQEVRLMRYHHRSEGGADVWGIKVIRDLRPMQATGKEERAVQPAPQSPRR